jgi:hypothetical protein
VTAGRPELLPSCSPANLARDEASELADELRGQHPSAPTPAPKPPPQAEDDEDALALKRERSDTARLQATLDYYAQRDLGSRRAVGWAFMGAGALGLGASAYVGLQSKDTTWFPIGVAGASLAAGGLISLLATSPFEDLAAYGREGASSPSLEEA